MNTDHKRTFITLALIFAGGCAFVFHLFYSSARDNAISQLNAEQRIHARQAAQDIEDFCVFWTRSLGAWCKMDEILDHAAIPPYSFTSL